MKLKINNLDNMQVFGARLAKCLKPGDVVALIGDLGTGKTTLSQSIGAALGVTDYMTSPTFAIVNQYALDLAVLARADLYRLDDEEELYDIGFEQYFNGENIVIVEWADKFSLWLEDYAPNALSITLEYAEEGRIVTLSGNARLIEALEEICC